MAVRKDLSGAAAPASGPKTFKFRANDGDYDRYNDRNAVKGWQLENYNANPIVLLNHDDGQGGFFDAPRPVMPIGKARAYIEGNALMADIEFDQDDPLAQAAQRKVEKGYLNAVSVRYRLSPGKFRENEKGGYDSDEQELLEISLVNIPGNQRAVRAKGFDELEARLADFDARLKALEPKPIDSEQFAKAFADAFTKK